MYLVELMPKAIKDLKGLPKPEAGKILEKIRGLEQGLDGDVKKTYKLQSGIQVESWELSSAFRDRKSKDFNLQSQA